VRRSDAEPLQPSGTPLTYRELEAIADITPQDVSAALDRFSEAVPRRFRNLLD
jgi:hypothetical protein